LVPVDLALAEAAIFEFVANLRFATALASCPRRAVAGLRVRARRYSSFQTGTCFPAQNTCISEFCSCCRGCSLVCTAFQQARIASKMRLRSSGTYIFFPPELVVAMSKVAAITLYTMTSLHVMFAYLRLKKKTDLLCFRRRSRMMLDAKLSDSWRALVHLGHGTLHCIVCMIEIIRLKR